MSNNQHGRDTTPTPFRSNAVDFITSGKNQNQSQVQALSFFEKLERASSLTTLERIFLTKENYDKLHAFRQEMNQTSLRQDYFYDFPTNRLLEDGMSLRIREDKDSSGDKRVTLKLREKSIEGSITHHLSIKEIEEWETLGKTKIPIDSLLNARIRPALSEVGKVGYVSTTRSLLFDGGVTVDNCFFSKSGRNFKDYEIRIKNPDCKDQLYALLRNKFLCIPIKPIEGSRYQRLMQS